jgi:hypothetical protein
MAGAESPHVFLGFCGTTEVVPCYKASLDDFQQAVMP